MTARARAALIRIVIALAVIGGVVWYLHTRDDKGGQSKAAPDGSAATAKSGGGGRRGGGGGGDRVVPVQVAVAEKKALPIWLEGLGTVAAFQQVTVRAQVDGRLDKVLFEEGKPVKKGEVIAQIDPRPFMVHLHQAQGARARDRAQLDAAKKNLERYQGLERDKLVAAGKDEEIQAQVGQFEGAVKIDQAQVENAQLMLDYAQVQAPIDGHRVQLTIDADMQRALEHAFHVDGYNGAAAFIDPRSGEVLALTSLPAYDPNDFASGISSATWAALNSDPLRPLGNRLIQGLYMPGSTFKIVMAITALEEGIITPDTVIRCGGSAYFYGRSFKCWNDSGHGAMTLRQMNH